MTLDELIAALEEKRGHNNVYGHHEAGKFLYELGVGATMVASDGAEDDDCDCPDLFVLDGKYYTSAEIYWDSHQNMNAIRLVPQEA